MTYLDMAKKYFEAWNKHDADAIVKTFADNGTYCDPSTGEISGDAIGTNAKHLWDVFPDLLFEIVSIAETGSGRVAAEWIMKGTNTGVFQGLPATGKRISLSGADIIEIGTDGIKSVKGYFDTRVIPEQLGLQVLVQPSKVGPFSFGSVAAVQSGKKTKPGAFAITTIWNTEAENDEVRARTWATATEMLQMDGFIGVSFFRIGNRGVTVSAWEKPEQTKQLMRGGSHAEAVKKFWTELSESAFTSIWVPDHINPLWVRCTACHKMNDYEKNSGVCKCGQPLPEPNPYF